MNKIVKIALGATLLLALGSTAASADVAKGQKLFTKKLKKACAMTGADVAAKHTQGEWTDINAAGTLGAEIKTICPNSGDVKAKYLPHLYDFFKEYGSDSGNVPSC